MILAFFPGEIPREETAKLSSRPSLLWELMLMMLLLLLLMMMMMMMMMMWWNMLEHVGTCRNMLEHVGTCRNMLEHVGTCWNMITAPGHLCAAPLVELLLLVQVPPLLCSIIWQGNLGMVLPHWCSFAWFFHQRHALGQVLPLRARGAWQWQVPRYE